MTRSESSLRSRAAILSLEHFPPLVREALLSDPKFADEYGLSISAVLSIAPGVSFQRTDLFDSVRSAFEGKADATIADADGETWRIEVQAEEDQTTIALIHDDRRLVGVQLALLSPDGDERLRSFRAEAHRVNLPAEARARTEALLAASPPNADELVALTGDLTDTPIAKQRALEESFSHGSVPFDLFVPRSERYYDRLVGGCTDGQSLSDYIAKTAEPHMRALVERDPFRGYLRALHVSGSQALGIALSKIAIEDADLIRVYEWLVDHGDMMSRAAAVEAGLLRPERSEAVREALLRLLHTIVTPPPVGAVEPYRLSSALFILVYGEMAHTRTLVSKPPYWRRLAALAQASLVARVVMAAGVDTAKFIEFAKTARAQAFLMQCYCDLRVAPRWIPDFAMPSQIKHEFAGRVFHAATVAQDAVVAAGWKGLLLDDVAGGLRNQIDLRQVFLPGPLEGDTASLLEIPEEHLAEVGADLTQPAITASSFSALANSTILFRIPKEVCDLAADALVRADYHLANVDETTPLVPHLLGLATAAAVARNEKLADALFIVVRKYRRLYPEAMTLESAFRVIMHASASRADLHQWCACVGSALTELSFQDMSESDAAGLHAHIVQLCEIVPELWSACGQAEAALRSVLNI